jgi:hypothetical protein
LGQPWGDDKSHTFLHSLAGKKLDYGCVAAILFGRVEAVRQLRSLDPFPLEFNIKVFLVLADAQDTLESSMDHHHLELIAHSVLMTQLMFPSCYKHLSQKQVS